MERVVLKQFKRGNTEAFKAIYESCFASAIRFAKVIMKQDRLAEDVVQEAFIRAFTYRKRFDEHRPFEHWFNRILINECRRSLKENKLKWMNAVPEKIETIGEKDEYAFEKYEGLYQALQDLPEIYRIPITLKYFYGYSEDTVAEILMLKKTTAKSRLHEGRQKLKQALLRLGYGGEDDE